MPCGSYSRGFDLLSALNCPGGSHAREFRGIQTKHSTIDFGIVLSDRRRYTSRLRAGENAKADETIVGGGPVSNVVSDFTAGVKGNNVPECTPPDDLRV